MPTAELLRLATAIEGHPDNAAAALLGGFVVSAATADGVEAIRFDAPRDLRAVLFIPELRLPTGEMRDVLPESVPRADAVANLAAVAIGVAGLAKGRFDLLGRLTVDRLHEPYRAERYPQLPKLVEAARERRGDRRVPVRRRLDDPGLRQFADRHLAHRGRVRRRRGRHRPHGSRAGRGAP